MNSEDKYTTKVIIEGLRNIANGSFTPKNNNLGLCAFIASINKPYYVKHRKLLESIFEKWKHFSGNYQYPVPNPHYLKNRIKAYEIYSEKYKYKENMYDKYYTYCKLRLELAAFLADKLEEML